MNDKVLAYFPIHYGKEYLEYAIRSIYNCIDKIAIFYTHQPSYGHATEMVNPDAEGEIWKAFKKYDPDNKIIVVRGFYNNEAQHRGTAVEWAQNMGYNLIVAADYDEVWIEEELKKALEIAKKEGKKEYRVPMIHFWRSFNYVCRDLCQPVRIINLAGEGAGYIPIKPVYHFGYAICDELMKYKWDIHGHKMEYRPNWFEEKWLKFPEVLTDLHPTNEKNFWDAEPFDKNELPEFMREHPYFNKEEI